MFSLNLARRAKKDKQIESIYNSLVILYETHHPDTSKLKLYGAQYAEFLFCLPDDESHAYAHTVSGVVLALKGKVLEAQQHFDQALATAVAVDDLSTQLDSDLQRLKYLKHSMSIAGRAQVLARITKIVLPIYDSYYVDYLMRQSEWHIDMRDYRRAQEIMDSLDISKLSDIDFRLVIGIERLAMLEKIALAQGQFEAAYWHKLSRDSLENTKQERVNSTARDYAIALTKLSSIETQVASLEAKNEDSQALVRASGLAVLTTVALLIAALFGIYTVYREKQRRVDNERQLQQRVNEQTKDLLARNEELSRFTHALSHDLKEPLRSVVSFSTFAQRSCTLEQAQEYLGYIHASGRQLSKLVDDIRAIQELGDMRLGQVDLAILMQRGLAEVRRGFGDKPIGLQASDLPTILADERLLKEAVKLVFDNAIRFNASELVSIRVQYFHIEGQHRLLISDNGMGIRADFHEKAFELFTRLERRELYSGSGLGLARVRRILEHLGGSARIMHSSPGRGTTVELSWVNGGLSAKLGANLSQRTAVAN